MVVLFGICVCVAPGTVSYDVDGDGDDDYCKGSTDGSGGEWWDCGWTSGDSAVCGDIEIKPGFIMEQYCDGATHDCVEKKSNCASCSANYECKSGDCSGWCMPTRNLRERLPWW